ncbi:uncharacterized protein LOC114882503 isoform X1 [Osmia bicornis bicornis]|uniref:uncharacterized protein LOC114882503 isoform X1 n=2 Tax=Osmia bicornis bicornis TaxID=1437191 RepID=UPI0010F5BE0B|nr:uncharacterized protein LOC114882503 isoform X1 [Osmia bicornis bicornis]
MVFANQSEVEGLIACKMKNILAVLMLAAIAKGSPVWGDFQVGQWNRGYQPPGQWYSPSGPSFVPPGQGFLPPGHSRTPPGHQHIPPGHMYLKPCQMLEQLLNLQANQPSNSLDKSCNVGWICQNPETDDMTITTIDGTQIIIGRQQQPNNWPNQNGIQSNNKNPMNDDPSQGRADNANLPNENSTPSVNNPTIPQTDNESSRREGGEGLIDIRIGDN